MLEKNRVLKTHVQCGNWIYPYSESRSVVKYSIKKPIILSLFEQEVDKKQKITAHGGIGYHLHGPRYVNIKLTENKLTIVSMENSQEEAFCKNLNWSCKYDITKLDRIKDIFQSETDLIKAFKYHYINKKEKDINKDKLSILITSILLQQYVKDKKTKFPKGLKFRKLTIAEIESIGGWC